ncbi:MAG TPA: ABC transporter substrate-binding protein [Candidatus Binataceae bacterium]|jgi:phospholipid transport system substrate-binding protein|nr:ABC transporter substrate-binding protein [Candidatus Binataceae bacterium]
MNIATRRVGIFRILAAVSVPVLVAVAISTAAAANGAAETSPMAVVKAAVNQALAIFRDSKTPLPQRRSKMRDLLAAHFDFAEMARSALGPHWQSLSEDKRKQFVDLFTAYVEYDFLNKIQVYRDLSFQFLKQVPIAGGYAQVNTRVQQPGKDPATMNFSLKQEGSDWKVTDVLINGLSMVGGDRTQFGLVIDNVGFDALMSDLQSKRNELEASVK